MTAEFNSFRSEKKIYAKSDGTSLSEHRKSCLKTLRDIKKDFESSINLFLSYYGISHKEFWEHVTFTVSNHDFGKINSVFQEKIRKIVDTGIPDSTKNLIKDIPHNYISPVFFCNEKLFNLWHKDRFNYAAIAAMYHHGPLFKYDTINNKGLLDRQETIVLEDIIGYYHENYGNLSLVPDKKIIEVINNSNSPFKPAILKEFLKKVILVNDKSVSEDVILARRWIFPLFKQLLHLSDWIGSGANVGELASKNLWERTNKKLLKQKNMDNSLRTKLSIKSKELPERAILQAPTGSGKTEAAIRWADKWNKSRFIFALPTRSLVDDIYIRFQGYSNTEGYFHSDTGILHSNSEYTFRYLKGDDPESHDFDKYFHRPVMVTTIDQILISLFNTGRWDAVNFSLALGCLVIDEVHVYDKYTMSLICELIMQSKNFHMPILIMSATLPPWLPKSIKELTGEVFPVIEVEDEISTPPFEMQIIKELDFCEILEEAKKGDVLVVANNVKSSLEIYQKLKHTYKNIKLINSRFIQSDRLKTISWAKSKDNSYKILVSTQVVEVGVDIDFDTLYTEQAPLDVIIQRCGRVNRARNPNKKSKVYIYKSNSKEQEISEFIYGKQHLERSIYEISNGIKTQQRLKEALGSVYLESEEMASLNEVFQEVHRVVEFCEKYEQGDGVHSISLQEADFRIGTRNNKFISILAVPEQFTNQVYQNRWKEFAISVPIRSYYEYIDKSGKYPIIRKLSYSQETGLEIPKEEVSNDQFFI